VTSLIPGRDQPGQRRPPGRRAMGTGTGILLITVGAILRFALAGGSPHGLNLHIVGVILILAGALGLLLPPLARGPLKPDRLRRWVVPRGHDHDNPRLEEIKRAAAADVAVVQQNDTFARPKAPGLQNDDL
jgi:hypothetical protein